MLPPCLMLRQQATRLFGCLSESMELTAMSRSGRSFHIDTWGLSAIFGYALRRGFPPS